MLPFFLKAIQINFNSFVFAHLIAERWKTMRCPSSILRVYVPVKLTGAEHFPCSTPTRTIINITREHKYDKTRDILIVYS